jgi:hypothetical protein
VKVSLSILKPEGNSGCIETVTLPLACPDFIEITRNKFKGVGGICSGAADPCADMVIRSTNRINDSTPDLSSITFSQNAAMLMYGPE